ncbi:MAG: response regulator [Thermoproteota archaeon]|nr:response regulator [Thermoproteota archaeon]
MLSSTHSILVVDDELDIVLIFKQALSRQGYTVFGFTDPLLALEHFKANSTDYGLVITDVRMPRMSGFELAAKIKVIKPDAKVVFMSAFEISDLEFSIPGIKINDFLRKPVDVKTLVRRVKVAMGN